MEQSCIKEYKDMSTRKLKSILRRSLTDDAFSTDDLYIIADILKQRDAGKGKDPPDAEAAWERFVTEKLQSAPDSPSAAETEKPIHWRNLIYQRCAIFAICSVTIFFSMLFTTQALGMDIMGTIVRWTTDIFYYESVSEDTNGFEGTRLEDFDFSGGELPGEFVPGWMPEGFQEANTKYYSKVGFENILAEYRDKADAFLGITLSKYDSAASLNNRHFEKQNPDVETYVFNNKVYVVTGNGRSDFLSATWSEGLFLLQVRGNISKDSFIKFLSSLGGTL